MMRFQTKMILILTPAVFLTVLCLGLWNFYEARKSIYNQTYGYMELILQETVNNDIDRRHRLLETSHMDQVDFFVAGFQKEALEAVRLRKTPRQGHFWILDGNGNILLSPTLTQADQAPLAAAWMKTAADAKKTPVPVTTGYSRDSGFRHFYATAFFEPWNWLVVYTLEDATVHRSVSLILWRTAVGIFLCMFGAVLGILWSLKRFLIRRVMLLKEAAALIADQKAVTRIDMDTDDELGELARSMETMSDKLIRHNEKQEKLQGQLKALNNDLATSNRQLEVLGRDMETQVKQRTRNLETVNSELSDNIASIRQELASTEQNRSRLAKKISELLLKQSDMVQHNTGILKKLKLSQDENMLLREQVKSYAELVAPVENSRI